MELSWADNSFFFSWFIQQAKMQILMKIGVNIQIWQNKLPLLDLLKFLIVHKLYKEKEKKFMYSSQLSLACQKNIRQTESFLYSSYSRAGYKMSACASTAHTHTHSLAVECFMISLSLALCIALNKTKFPDFQLVRLRM